MIPSLTLIVGAYVMFRCIETFCRRRDGQYSQIGFAIVILAAAGTLLVSAVATADVLMTGTRSTAGFTPNVGDYRSPADKAQSDRETDDLLRRTRELPHLK